MNVVFGGRIPQIVDNKIDVLRTIRDILEKLRSSCPTYTCFNIFNCAANLSSFGSYKFDYYGNDLLVLSVFQSCS